MFILLTWSSLVFVSKVKMVVKSGVINYTTNTKEKCQISATGRSLPFLLSKLMVSINFDHHFTRTIRLKRRNDFRRSEVRKFYI